MGSAIDTLRESLGAISDLGRARALLAWDERTQMPPGGAEPRADGLATLARIHHERLCADELGDQLDAAASEADGLPYESIEASLVRVTRREWEKARRVPADLRAEITRTTSVAEHAWVKARENSDFKAFLPHLEKVVELRRRYVECFAPYEHVYDPLLDDFEPGMSTATLVPLLAELRDGLTPLLERVADAPQLDDSPLRGRFDLPAQHALARAVVETLPLSEGEWRLDDTVHPFATAIAPTDIRITTRFDEDYLGTGLYSVMHEAGHGMYENGMPSELRRTPLQGGASLGFHESQSRLWENWVGRGRPYLRWALPMLREHLGSSLDGVDAESLYRAANRVEPSLIRVEADELTYNLHIALRFELEVEIFEDRIELAELPEAWNDRMERYLGVQVPDDAHGVLQDVHWGAGAFGYFPTYSLGNVIAGQLWAVALEAMPDLEDGIERGELQPLNTWLRDSLYRYGSCFEPLELIERVVGGPLDVGPLVAHLDAKLGELYSV
jgi:carboxypeptidase Taq